MGDLSGSLPEKHASEDKACWKASWWFVGPVVSLETGQVTGWTGLDRPGEPESARDRRGDGETLQSGIRA